MPSIRAGGPRPPRHAAVRGTANVHGRRRLLKLNIWPCPSPSSAQRSGARTKSARSRGRVPSRGRAARPPSSRPRVRRSRSAHPSSRLLPTRRRAMSRARWSDDGGSDSGSSALYSDSDRGDGGTRTGDFLRRAPPATTTTTTDAGAGAGAGDDDARVRSRTVRSKAGWGDVTARGSGEKPSRPHLPPDRARRDRGPSSASIIADALGKVVDADDAFHDDVEMARRGAAG
eukprot:31431-Pelagococcus_subviridis.AAC.13